MRCFDGSEQQRCDPHTPRQCPESSGEVRFVHLKPRVVSPWRFSKKIIGRVTSRSGPLPKLPQHGYRSIVAPWCPPPPSALHRALRRMAGLVFLLVFWARVLAGACHRHGVGGFVVKFIITITGVLTAQGATA